MAQTARPIDHDDTPGAAPAASRVVAFEEVAAAWSESPARELHQQLVETFVVPPPHVEKLPLRTRAVVMAGAVMAPWGVIAAGFALFR